MVIRRFRAVHEKSEPPVLARKHRKRVTAEKRQIRAVRTEDIKVGPRSHQVAVFVVYFEQGEAVVGFREFPNRVGDFRHAEGVEEEEEGVDR